jgi:hypothetical protein
MFIVYLFDLPGLPSFISSLNFLGCVGIAGDQRSSFIRHAVSTGADHCTIHQLTIQGIYGKDVEYSATYDAAMYLDYSFIFRHRTSRNAQDATPLGLII